MSLFFFWFEILHKFEKEYKNRIFDHSFFEKKVIGFAKN
jgi:hypothetical protein